MTRARLVLLVVLLGLCLATAARAAPMMTVTNCSNDTQLQADVATADSDNAGDTINFSCGGDIQLTKTLSLSGDMTIDGTGQSVTLDGQNKYEDISILNNVSGPGGPAVTLRGLTLTNGAESSNSYFGGVTQNPEVAGGVYNQGSLTVLDCSFTDNSTTAGGTPPDGGAISSVGSLSVTDSTFTGNDGFTGGAIFMWLFDDVDDLAQITGSTFTGNATTVDSGTETGGGAIQYEGAGSASITTSAITGNMAAGAGGGIATFGPQVTITDSTIAANQALNENGGGILAWGTDNQLTITNSTISGNTGVGGGGIWAHSYVVSLENTTFAGNDAEGHPGAAVDVDGSTVTTRNSIFDDAGGSNCSAALTDAGYNIENGSDCGLAGTGSKQNTDAMLDPTGLHNNGGPTKTIALLSGSPAIDQIPIVDCPPTDQRDYPRPDLGESNCDMGAYEYGSAPPLLVVTTSGSGSGNVTSSPTGISCPTTCSDRYATGTQVTLAAVPSGGSTFAGWSGGGCSGTGTCKVTLSANTTVAATFTAPVPPKRTMTVSVVGSGTVRSVPAGITCPHTCASSFADGAKVTLSAKAASGSRFAGWSGGGCAGTGTCAETLNSNQRVTATFKVSPTKPPKPSCTVAASGDRVLLPARRRKHQKTGTVAFIVRCNQSASARLKTRAKVTVKRRHQRSITHTISLPTVRGSAKAGARLVLTVKLPASVLRPLGAGARESVSTVLTATNANGTATARTTIARLRAR